MKRGLTVPPAVRRGSVGSRRGSGGPVGTPWRAQGVRTSIVHLYGPVERSVEPRRVPSCQNSVPTETRRNAVLAQRDPASPDGRPAARRRHRPADFHRSLPGLGGPQLLSAEAGAIVVPCSSVDCNTGAMDS